MRGGAHLDQAERIVPVIGPEVEIADRQRLLKHRVVGFAHQRHQDGLVVTHVVAAHLARAVGQTVRMFVVGGAQQQQRRRQRAASDNDDIGGVVFFARRRASHERR